MRPTFNLIDEAWIPCIREDGGPVTLGLRDVLARAHELRGISAECPPVTAALYRLLLAVLYRVYMPTSFYEWGEIWERGSLDTEPLDAYLSEWHERFDLFHPERPFYQAPDERVKVKSVISLIPDMASGNNATLFDHHTEDSGAALRPAEAARALVMAQAFGLAGLSGLKQKFTDGSCARGVLFLGEGHSLFETLILNLTRYTRSDPISNTPADRPAWEMDDPFANEDERPWGYMDYLTWQNRRVLLMTEETPEGGVLIREMTMGPALRLPADILDPMKHYEKNRRGFRELRFDEEKALWRDSAALFRIHVDSDDLRPPYTFVWLSALAEEGYLDPHAIYRYMGLGMANSQAKVDFYREEHLPLPLDYLTITDLVNRLSDALETAEDVSKKLWGASRTLATYLLSPEADAEGGRQPAREDLNDLSEHWNIQRAYWSRLEVPFRAFAESLPSHGLEALAAWYERLRRTAWQAFEQAESFAGRDPRGLKAAVKARGQLAMGLGKVLKQRKENV